MNAMRQIPFVLAVIWLICGCTNPSVGQFAKRKDPSYWIDTANFNCSFGSVQRASSWCWAACIETTVNSLIPGRCDLQESLAGRLYGGLNDAGATVPEIARAINGVTFRYGFEQGRGVIFYQIRAYEPTKGLDLSIEEFKTISESKDARVIAALNHHAVVIDSVTAYGGKITEFSVWDPWPRKGRRTIPSSALIDINSPDYLRGYVIVEVHEQLGYR